MHCQVNTVICLFHDFTEQQKKQYFEFSNEILSVYIPTLKLNPFQVRVAFNIETIHILCRSNQMTDVYIKCNTKMIQFRNQVKFQF